MHVAQDVDAIRARSIHGALAQHDVGPAVRVQVRGPKAVGAAGRVEASHGLADVALAAWVREHPVKGWQAVGSSGAIGQEQVRVLVVVEVEHGREATAAERVGRVQRHPLVDEGAIGLLDVQLVALEAGAVEGAIRTVEVGQLVTVDIAAGAAVPVALGDRDARERRRRCHGR